MQTLTISQPCKKERLMIATFLKKKMLSYLRIPLATARRTIDLNLS